MQRAARSDLFLGTVYGAGLSLAMWTLALDPPGLGPTSLGVCLGAAVLGLAPRRVPRLGPLDAPYAAALAGALIGGPGLSVTAATLAHATRRLVGAGTTGTHPVAPWTLRLAASMAAAVFAAGAAQWTAGSSRALSFLAVHTAVYLTVERVVRIGARRWCAARHHAARTTVVALQRSASRLAAITIGCALAATATNGSPAIFGWLATFTAIVSVAAASRRTARLQRTSLRRRFALRRHAAVALACSGAARGAGADQALRLESMVRAVAARMALDSALTDALGCAALLFHAQARRDARRRPLEIDDTVFPHPVSTVLRTVEERWDGMGPRRLRSRRIHVGARVLSAVSAWLAWCETVDADEAVGRVLDESGRRFDPLVVDALIDEVDAGAGHAARGPAAPGLELARPPVGATPLEPVTRTLDWAGRELDAFYDIARSVRAGLDLDATLTLVAARLAVLVPHGTMVVYRLDHDRCLRPIFAAGTSCARFERVTIRFGERVSGRCVLDRSARIGAVGAEDEPDLPGFGPDAELDPLGASIAAPMVVGERAIGVLTLYDRRQRRFGPEDRRCVSRVAACVAERVDGAPSANGPAAGDTMTDPLTGLPNAAFLEGAITGRLQSAAPFGLLGIRLRGVEQIAAKHGAHAADQLLARAAARLGHAHRANDTAVRLGDDLFVVLTSSRNADELLAHAARVMRTLREPEHDTDTPATRVRPVVAHACSPDDGVSVDDLLETLDARLADAVERGRGVIPFRGGAGGVTRDSAVGAG